MKRPTEPGRGTRGATTRRVAITLLCTTLCLSAAALPALTVETEPTPTARAVISTAPLQGLGSVEHHALDSTELEHRYHVVVSTPESAAGEPERRFPTVYLLDGGMTFPLLASYARYLRFGEEIPDLLIVGISYGNEEWGTGNQRSRDYTAPAPDREHYGGAAAFRRFLNAEVFPLIESKYPADRRRRIVFGHSIGGQFVLDTALRAPATFWGYIASNPALHRNLPAFLGEAPKALDGPATDTRPRLFVASAEFDDARFRAPAQQWIEHWTASSDRPWQLETRTLVGHTHMSAVPASFRQGVAWLFTDEFSRE